MALKHEHDDSLDDGLPPRLIADLRDAFGQTPATPDGFDHRVLVAATSRKQLRQMPKWRLVLPIASGAAAACLLLATWFASPVHRTQYPPVSAGSNLHGDLNADGTVNVLDAYLLARRVDRSEPLDSRWDIDGNSRVDRRDADQIAALAVSLRRTPS